MFILLILIFTLIVGFVGIGIILHRTKRKHYKVRRRGRRVHNAV